MQLNLIAMVTFLNLKRLTGKEYSQKYGIDFDQTYAPVAEHSLVRLILAITLELDLYSKIIDISTAFLNSKLKFDVYISQPQGFNDGSGRVLKLFKSLYGLKQGAHDWYQTFDACLRDIGLISDDCIYVYTKYNDSNILILWVDDMILSSSSLELLEEVISLILTKFKGKDLGDLSDNQFLNWKIKRTENSIVINQMRAVDDILKRFGMKNSKRVKTPSDPQVVLGLKDGNSVDITD